MEQTWVVAGQPIAETGIQDSGRLRGRGYWDKTETEADVDTGTSTETMKEQELRLRTLERLGVRNSSSQQYNLANTTGHSGALYLGKQGVPKYVQVLLIVTVRRHEEGQLTSGLWLIENT